MKLPKLTDLVGKDKKVYFSFYRDGELWYKAMWREEKMLTPTSTQSTPYWFEFPIPPDDMKGAIFKAEDKSIIFMRFIRKHLEYLAACIKEAEKVNEQAINNQE